MRQLPGRDWRGHFSKPPDVGEPCPHACCQGKRQHPPGMAVRPTPRTVADVLGQLEEEQRKAEGRRKPRPRADPLREAYAAHVAHAWGQAEAATNGYTVTPEAARRGLTGADLYHVGRGRAHPKHASDDLRAAWDKGDAPRPISLAEFRRSQREREQPPEDAPAHEDWTDEDEATWRAGWDAPRSPYPGIY